MVQFPHRLRVWMALMLEGAPGVPGSGPVDYLSWGPCNISPSLGHQTVCNHSFVQDLCKSCQMAMNSSNSRSSHSSSVKSHFRARLCAHIMKSSMLSSSLWWFCVSFRWLMQKFTIVLICPWKNAHSYADLSFLHLLHHLHWDVTGWHRRCPVKFSLPEQLHW